MKKFLSFLMCLALTISIAVPSNAFAVSSGKPDSMSQSATDSDTDMLTVPTDDDTLYAEDRVIVKMKQNYRERRKSFPRDDHKLDLVVKHKKAKLLNPSKKRDVQTGDRVAASQNNMFVLTLETSGKQAVQDALKRLNADPKVEYATPVYYLKVNATPNDLEYGEQWALPKIQAPDAWDITTGSADVVVGIIDTGIDGRHADLVSNLWHNSGETMDSTDTDNNGYIDDLYGYDFVYRKGGIPSDSYGHGTHVAGIVGAAGNNGIGVTGVNWNVKVAWLGCGVGAGIDISAAIEAINYAKNMGITIVNASWGGYGEWLPLKETIDSYNGLFVAAAGNEGRNIDADPHYPAGLNCANIISVASTDQSDQLSVFSKGYSNYGVDTVDIVAPGSNILSTARGDGNVEQSGTSMASPMVAGVAALVKASHPEYTTAQIKAAILNGADVLPNLVGKVSKGRRLNAFYAISDRPKVENITITNQAPITLDINEMEQLSVTIAPEKASKIVIWTSSDPNIATVSADGAVKGVSTGTASITATSNTNTAKKATIVVHITNDVSEAIMFKDINFKGAVIENLKKFQGYEEHTIGSKLYPYDLEKVTRLDVQNKGINCMDELIYFINLEYLFCNDNELGELDLSKNINLMQLFCYSNQLSELNLSKNTALNYLSCYYNQLSALYFTYSGKQYSITANGNGYFTTESTGITIPYGYLSSRTRIAATPRTGDTFVNWTLSDNVDSTSSDNDFIVAEGGFYPKTGTGRGYDLTANFTGSVPPTDIMILPTTVALNAGETQQLEVTTKPTNTTDKSVTWSSIDGAVATVDAEGLVTAIAPGTAIITVASNADATKKATCTVMVGLEATPGVFIDYVAERLMGFAVGERYSLNSNDVTVADTTYAIDDSWFGSTVSIVKKSNITSTLDSIVQKLYVPPRPTPTDLVGVSETAAGLNNGRITGTNNMMEYSGDGGVAWEDVTGTQITGLAPGTYQVRVKATTFSFKSNAVSIEVGTVIPITSIKLNKTSTTLSVGSSETLMPTVTPANTTDKSVTWSSSDATVATVKDGKVTAKKGGKTVISATSAEGKFTAKCTVTVTVPAISIKDGLIWKTNIVPGEKTYISWSVYPHDTTDKTTLTSSNPKVATVKPNGTITGVGSGKATITIAAGKASMRVNITVHQYVTMQMGKTTAIMNGTKTSIDNAGTKPFKISGKTMLPLRFVGEKMGGRVKYVNDKTPITMIYGGTTVEFKLGDKKMKVIAGSSSKIITLDVAAQKVHGKTYIPLRAIGQALGFDVYYEAGTEYIVVNNPKMSTEIKKERLAEAKKVIK